MKSLPSIPGTETSFKTLEDLRAILSDEQIEQIISLAANNPIDLTAIAVVSVRS